MTVYRTCYGCVLRGKPCERRDGIAKAISGLGIQSLKFKCDARKPLFAIGAPVWVETVYDMNGDGDENGVQIDFYPGHVVQDLGTKALVYIRPGSRGRGDKNDDDPLEFVGKNNGFCKVSLKRVTARDGEVESICKDCELPASFGHQTGYPCNWANERALEAETLAPF